ncbi:phospholipase [Streptomyces sp. NPDC029526]|uniref:phospholipase n=1 Tax=Streptomyces sp. NPDC029526 TaxID=3155728 RepID=UPI00340A4455
MGRRLATVLAAPVLAVVTALGTATAAHAAPADKARVLSGWTQTGASSQQSWNAAQADRPAWAAYGFDWSTDHCSSSPDNPFGFPFSASCARHDFGYRNYKAMGIFSAHTSRLDDAFHEDLERVCAGYGGATGTACDSTAWTYYQAVRALG